MNRTATRAIAALALAGTVLSFGARADADTASDRAEVRRKRAAVAAQIDTLRATDAQVEAALAALEANVSSTTAELRSAERKAAEAEAEFAAATAEVEAKQGEIAELDSAVQEMAIAAFVRPVNSGSLLDSLDSDTLGDAEIKQSLLEAKSANQLDLLDQLERAREDLEFARATAERASADAARYRTTVDTKLDEVTTARNQQQKVVADVQSRLDHRLSEAASLAELDSSLSAKLAAEQAALAAQLAKQREEAAASAPAPGPVSIVGSGSIVSVRGIQVHKSIADQLARMLSAADADGIRLSGGGYRSSARQIELRKKHCGTSYYAVYQMSPSRCRPPTARPGQSNHERGLAIDFTYNGRVINSRSSPAFQWLKANAASYGFYNLPSEPWHWSVNGN